MTLLDSWAYFSNFLFGLLCNVVSHMSQSPSGPLGGTGSGCHDAPLPFCGKIQSSFKTPRLRKVLKFCKTFKMLTFNTRTETWIYSKDNAFKWSFKLGIYLFIQEIFTKHLLHNTVLCIAV